MARRSTHLLVAALSSAAVILACSADIPVAPEATPLIPEGIPIDGMDNGHRLAGASASAACTAGGGVEQLELLPGFLQTVIGKESATFPRLPDMQVANETGAQPGRFLYRTHELATGGAVSVTDLTNGVTRILAQRSDLEHLDGIVWTPWGTLLVAEEVGIAAQRDPAVPSAGGGLVYEVNPGTGALTPRPALGSSSHEGMRFDKQNNLYGVSDFTPGYIFKFIADRAGDLSAGKLYALRIVQDAGDRTGFADWVALDRTVVTFDAQAEATAKGATGYDRPEGVLTGPSSGFALETKSMLYVSVTGENRVLAINLQPAGAPAGQVLVTDYIRVGVNAPADFTFPDNLARNLKGDLFVAEDPGGSAATGKTQGDDVWMAPFDAANPGRALPLIRLLSLTDCDAEPTGLYIGPSDRSLFIDVAHRGGSDPRDLSIAVTRNNTTAFSRAPSESRDRSGFP